MLGTTGTFNQCSLFPEDLSIWEASHLSMPDFKKQQFQQYIDSLGKASAEAQKLNTPITTFTKLITQNDAVLFVYSINKTPVGFLKSASRHLFLCKEGVLTEVDPICCLDFYVSKQRQGTGKLLFDGFLNYYCTTPQAVAYDRPSPKLLSFLQKYFALSQPIPQANAFTVFPDFWLFNTPYNRNRRRNLPSSLDGRPLTAKDRKPCNHNRSNRSVSNHSVFDVLNLPYFSRLSYQRAGRI
ncbi:hypothetical protein P9112_014673 [Eukaryota sp. TZLM1-RC]